MAKILDFSKLGDELYDVLSAEIEELLEAEGEDAGHFIGELSRLSASAALSGDAAALEEISANLPWIAERHRVRAVNSKWDLIDGVLRVVTKAATAAVSSFIPVDIESIKKLF